MTTSFTCQGQPIDHLHLIEVGGELDIHTCRELEACLSELPDKEASQFVLDLSDVTFVDSTALGVLVAAHHNSSTPLRVVASHPQVLKVLRVTGLHDVFSVFYTREEALTAMGHAVQGGSSA